MSDRKQLEAAARLHEAGDLKGAEKAYKALLTLNRRDPDLLNLYGVLKGQLGDAAASVRYIQQAIAIKSDDVQFYWNLAMAQAAAGARKAAMQLFLDIGQALIDAENFDGALAAYRQGLTIDSGNPQLGVSAGIALGRMHRWDECVAAFDDVLAAHPDFTAAVTNRGNALWGQGNWPAAMRDYRRAAELEPRNAVAQLNCGFALGQLGHTAEGLAAYERALKLDPAFAKAHYDYGQLLLMAGCYDDGFPHLEWRWHDAYRYKEPRRAYPQPVWKGEPASSLGGKLLVFPEQGYGDMILLSRYVPHLAAAGYDVLFEVRPALKRLFEQSFGNVAGVTLRDFGSAGTDFAAYVGLYSVPGFLRTTLQSVPSAAYLHTDKSLRQEWKSRIDGLGTTGLKVGLVWSGDPRPEDLDAAQVNRQRSLSLAQFARFATVPGIAAFSLQKGAPAEEALTPPDGLILHDLMPDVTDFADTAAMIDALDIVIAVDTAVVNLAGALGKTVWALLRVNSDWRWSESDPHSAWYPTARLFRQVSFGDWNPVLNEVRDALLAEVAKRP